MDARKAAEAGPVLGRRLLADQRPALARVLLREQDVETHVRAVAVERVAIGERELRALGDDVDELGLGELREVVAAQERELLERDRACRPTAASCRP